MKDPSMYVAGFLFGALCLATLVSIGLHVARVSISFLSCLVAAMGALAVAQVTWAITHAVASPGSGWHYLSWLTWGGTLVAIVRRFRRGDESTGRVAAGALGPIAVLMITVTVAIIVGFLVKLAPQLVFKGF